MWRTQETPDLFQKLQASRGPAFGPGRPRARSAPAAAAGAKEPDGAEGRSRAASLHLRGSIWSVRTAPVCLGRPGAAKSKPPPPLKSW